MNTVVAFKFNIVLGKPNFIYISAKCDVILFLTLTFVQ